MSLPQALSGYSFADAQDTAELNPLTLQCVWGNPRKGP